MTSAELSNRDEQIADRLLEAAIGIEAVADLLHSLGTAKLSGDFTIKAETVKWIADQIEPISRVVMNQHHLLMGNDGAASI